MKKIKINIILKIGGIVGIIGVLCYFLQLIIGEIIYGGYNLVIQTMSDLTACDAPSRTVSAIFLFVYGLFSVISTFCFWYYFKSKIENKTFNVGAILFLVANFVFFIGLTFFPKPSIIFTGWSFQYIMHLVTVLITVLISTVSFSLLIAGFLKSNHKVLGIIVTLALFFVIAGVALVKVFPTIGGILERISINSIIILNLIFSIYLIKEINLIKIKISNKQ